MNFGKLTFNSAGAVHIEEDSDTLLKGANTSKGLTLISTKGITQEAGSVLKITENTTLNGGDGDVILTNVNNQFDSLTVTGRNVAIRDSEGDLKLIGENSFSGTGFVIVANRGLGFDAKTKLGHTGTSSTANAVLIAGESAADVGINEFNANKPDHKPQTDTFKSGKYNLVVVANSLAANGNKGSHLDNVDPVNTLTANFKFGSTGKGSVDDILTSFGSVDSLKAAQLAPSGTNTTDVSIFSSVPFTDVQIADVASLDLRRFLKSVLKQDQAGVVVFEPAGREGLTLTGEGGYFGPYLTTGYEYLSYVAPDSTRASLDSSGRKVFPLYIDYIKDKDGNWVIKNLFDQP
jgi:hypothetical protein